MSSILPGTGKVIKHGKIVLIYWGAGWARSPQISSAELTRLFSAILATPYFARMVQYGGICNPRILLTLTDTTTEFPESINGAPAFHQSELETMIAGHIDDKTVPAPDASPDLLYMVVSQLSVVCIETANAGDAGFHTTFPHNGTNVHYAWVSNSGSLTTGNTITKTFVHELSEACSDPEIDSFKRSDNQEIGDLCNTQHLPMPNIKSPTAPAGIVIQGYFSDFDNGCVLPTSYSLAWWAKATHSNVNQGVRKLLPRGGSLRAMFTCSDLLASQIQISQTSDLLGGTLAIDGLHFTPGGSAQIVITGVPNRTADFERSAQAGTDGSFHFSEEFHCTSTNTNDAFRQVTVTVTDLATLSSASGTTSAAIWVCSN